jgi:hypothetical protein
MVGGGAVERQNVVNSLLEVMYLVHGSTYGVTILLLLQLMVYMVLVSGLTLQMLPSLVAEGNYPTIEASASWALK